MESQGSSAQCQGEQVARLRWLRPYIIAVDVAALALVATTAAGLPASSWPVLLLFVIFAALAESWRVPFSGSGEVSLCFIVNLAAAALFGPCFGALAAAGGSLFVDLLLRRKGVSRAAFNAGQFALAAGLAGLAFQLLGSPAAGHLSANALAYASAALVFIVTNSALTSIVFALHGQRFLRAWARVLSDAGIFYLAMAPLGALLANAYLQSPWALLYFPLLAWVIYRGFSLYAKLKTETKNALVVLAESLERRDPYTFHHSLRVADYSRQIAHHLGLPQEQLELIVSAAQIHDLGKISIDNRILFKEGPLTDEERRQVNKHAAAGAELAEQFSMYRAGADIIRGHHERWDGAGYPDGLAGQAIPLGARIIAVADVYDAMTSDRPYRAALPHEVAVAELERGRGSQFDAALVDVFLALGITAEAATSEMRTTTPSARLASGLLPQPDAQSRLAGA